MKVFRKFTFMFVAGFLPERFPRRRTRRMFAAACLLAVGFVLVFGAGAAQAPVFSSAEVTWRTLTVTFDRALKPNDPNGSAVGRPDGRAFTVEVTATDGTTRTLSGACGATGMGTISGTQVSVSLCGTVYEGETATVSYDKTKASNSPTMRSVGTRLQGTGGAEAASFDRLKKVTNNTPDEFQPPRRKDRWSPTLLDVTVWGGGAPRLQRTPERAERARRPELPHHRER